MNGFFDPFVERRLLRLSTKRLIIFGFCLYKPLRCGSFNQRAYFQGPRFERAISVFWRQGSEEEGTLFLDKWFEDAKNLGIQKIRKAAETINAYRFGLLNHFKHRIIKAAAEGLNNKIKTMKRRSYGFRVMEYFKLRLYHLHQ